MNIKSISFTFLKPFGVLLLAMAVSVPTYAATPSKQSVEKLINILQIDDLTQDMQAQSADLIRQIIGTHVIQNNQPISETQDQQLRALANQYVAQLDKKTDHKYIRQQAMQNYIQAAQIHFTQDEIDAQIDFYGSATGQAILNKQPKVMRSYMQHLLPILMEHTQKNVNDILPNLKNDIQKILASS